LALLTVCSKKKHLNVCKLHSHALSDKSVKNNPLISNRKKVLARNVKQIVGEKLYFRTLYKTVSRYVAGNIVKLRGLQNCHSFLCCAIGNHEILQLEFSYLLLLIILNTTRFAIVKSCVCSNTRKHEIPFSQNYILRSQCPHLTSFM